MQDDSERWKTLTGYLEPFHRQALGTARRLTGSETDGDDLYQDAVLRAFQKLHSLREPASFRSWFFAILFSIHRSQCRRSFWKRFLTMDSGDGKSLEWVGEDKTLFHGERLRTKRIREALSSLPVSMREALLLFEVEGFHIHEIAKVQNVSESAVKSRLSRGRQRMRAFYEKETSPSVSSEKEPSKGFGDLFRGKREQIL
ncbi:MAG: RNA polymerase sigma factor [Candidatus Eisenbacteria bacterium]|uniref:RNA polymerase sigma factor n=1 Tax=Eiseniibacteriota bacterium TaxID=2212470 RepID=A0A7Y2EBQ4_UNCEI|nr:RNA polymerase sigma factor [Candidatus Eisenbacteria bacterium]